MFFLAQIPYSAGPIGSYIVKEDHISLAVSDTDKHPVTFILS